MTTHAYQADDAGLTVASLEFLASAAGQPLLQAAIDAVRAGTHQDAKTADRLRKLADAAHVRAALVIAAASVKATAPKGKFAGMPFFWAVPEALEQATSLRVARYKASLVPAGVTVFDCCAGIGGDALAFAEHHDVVAVESSAVRAWCIAKNAKAAGVSDRLRVREMLLTPDHVPGDDHAFFHIDPARRSNNRRSHHYEDMQPGPDVIAALIARMPRGMIKLSPGVDFDSLPPGRLELISERGVVVQALLHIGDPAPDCRTATVIDDAVTSFTDRPALAETCPAPAAFVFELDGAFTRAQLAAAFAAQHQLAALTPDGGYLTGDAQIEHPALTSFRVLSALPYHEKQLITAIKDIPPHSTRPIEVKTRGLPDLDTDALQKKLTRDAGACGLTVLLYRHDRQIKAVIAARL